MVKIAVKVNEQGDINPLLENQLYEFDILVLPPVLQEWNDDNTLAYNYAYFSVEEYNYEEDEEFCLENYLPTYIELKKLQEQNSDIISVCVVGIGHFGWDMGIDEAEKRLNE